MKSQLPILYRTMNQELYPKDSRLKTQDYVLKIQKVTQP